MVDGGGREIATLGEIDANSMEDYRAYGWEDGDAVLGKIPKTSG